MSKYLNIENCPTVIITAPSGKNVEFVQVVRCKDCKHLVEIDDTSNLYVCDRIDIGMDGEPDFLSPEIDFCSKGKRKEGLNE